MVLIFMGDPSAPGWRGAGLGCNFREVRAVRPYTSSQPWKCSNSYCKNDAKYKSEDGKFFYCEVCAKSVLKMNPDESAAALLRFIDWERQRGGS